MAMSDPRFPTYTVFDQNPSLAVTVESIRYVHEQLPNGEITIPAGTTTDGASIPRPFRWIVGQPLNTRFWRASLLHDVLYRDEIGKRADADDVFLDYLRIDGVGKIRRSLMWLGVRLAFWKGWGR